MICKKCGIKNDPDNKFCTNCGEELISDDYITHNICSNCGTDNELENKFCISCGFNLSGISDREKSSEHFEVHTERKEFKINKHLDEHSKFSNNRKVPHKKENKYNRKSGFKSLLGLKGLWIMIGVIIGSVILVSAFDLIFHKYRGKQEKRLEIKSSNPVIEANVFEIASKFVCSCGSCNEESLEVCKCERAVEERQFIRDYLEQKQKPDDIVIAVANKYGWLKAEFASKYKLDPSRIWNPNGNQLLNNKNLIQRNSEILNNKAAFADSYTIYSAFNCPCGQCQKDDLSDCSCNHPNGANQIKRFIDEKIKENKYTINEIIQTVNKKFGGKKI